MRAVLIALLLLLGNPDEELRALYEEGLAYPEFLEEAERRKPMWTKNTAVAVVPDSLLARAEAVGGQWHLLAVAVDGCSDSANIIPYLGALVDAVEGLNMRIVHSSKGRHLMEANRTPDGRPATPTVLLLDAEFEQAGVFIERPAPLQEWALANKDDMDPGDFMREKFSWYDTDLGVTSMSEIVDLMEAAAAGR